MVIEHILGLHVLAKVGEEFLARNYPNSAVIFNAPYIKYSISTPEDILMAKHLIG
jgi:hypothetical protein